MVRQFPVPEPCYEITEPFYSTIYTVLYMYKSGSGGCVWGLGSHYGLFIHHEVEERASHLICGTTQEGMIHLHATVERIMRGGQ